ncbi:MFS transporter [Propionibacterium australiense]|uniref:MFS transporter n=1 Tax=Propionibacterium australiense TaxID=119981 RepID=A0A8B3FJK5_9ACTN|nr:MFS transporter [Propionibacterium australiense]RLP06074.1 MFS transporter [Propionibacterium australiense]
MNHTNQPRSHQAKHPQTPTNQPKVARVRFVAHAMWLGLFRLVAGAALGLVMPICMSLARAASGMRFGPFCISLVMGGIPAGGIIAACLSYFCASWMGWRPLFIVGALLGPLLLPIVMGMVRSGATGFGVKVSGNAATERSAASGACGALVKPAVAGALATFFFLLSFYGLVTWLTRLMTEIQIPLDGALQLTLMLNIGAVVGSILTGLLAMHYGALALVVASGLTCGTCLVLVPSGLFSGIPLMMLVALLGMSSPSTQNLVNSLVADAVELSSRAAVLGITLGIGRLGAVAAPVIGSFVLLRAGHGQSLASPAGAVFLAFAVSCVAGVAAACWLGVLARRGRALQATR